MRNPGMSTRSDRRSAARTIVKLAPAAETDALVIALEKADLLKGYCVTYKTRLERIAMAMQFISNRIIENNIPAAQVAMRAILANDMKEAREAVGNREQALAIAVDTLQMVSMTPRVKDALSQIKTLAPEIFNGGAVEMTAPVVGKA